MTALTATDAAPLRTVLAGCQRGDRNSQRRLYTLFYAFANSVCLRYTRNPDEAMEAVNDGFLKVFRDLGRFDVDRYTDVAGSFRGWLKRIMVHTAIDHYRATGKLASMTGELDDVAHYYPDTGRTPLDDISFDEVVSLIQHLSPAYRTVFNLYVIDGFTHEEISNQLGISVGTSKSNLAKARIHLKSLLSKIKHDASARYVG